MEKSYKALLWDAEKQTFEEVYINDYKDALRFIKCEVLSGWYPYKEVVALVDDEALINGTVRTSALWFKRDQYLQPIKGNILFINHETDDDGNTLDITKEQIQFVKSIPLIEAVNYIGNKRYNILKVVSE